MRVLPILSSLIALAAVTASAGAAPDKRAAEKASLMPTGEVRSCIRLNEISDTLIRDDSTIDYVMRNREIWRNSLPQACSGLGFQQRYWLTTSRSEICSIDAITVLQWAGKNPLVAGATCGLGKFQRVNKVGS